MAKIYLDTDLVWNKDRLPSEREAMKLLGRCVEGEVNPEAAVALSVGIETIVNGKKFEVFLDGEERRI